VFDDLVTSLVLCFSYLLPEHLGPCTLRITYSGHTDLSVKFQSHRSRYSLALSFWYLDNCRYSMCNVFLLWKSCLVGCYHAVCGTDCPPN
jgi:hypothetical protein